MELAVGVKAVRDPRMDAVEGELGAIPDCSHAITNAVARAVDEVVDPVRSARWQLAELLQPEKTVIGIRVENVIRMDLELARASHLDVVIAGENVDIKFTLGQNWAIPPEAMDEICLLVSFRESDHSVSAGLVRISEGILNAGRNRDGKRGISREGKTAIRWLARNVIASKSMIGFMASLQPQVRAQITDSSVGAQVRINRLFTSVMNSPIPEDVVQAVAQHQDWTRRLRPDAANPKAPGAAVGYDVLRQSSPQDRRRIAELGLQPLTPGFCISVGV
jgi:hypothetical protein